MAGRGEDVSRFFAHRGQTMHPIQRANVDLAASMPPELGQAAAELNTTCQAAAKDFVRRALDQRRLARGARKAS